MSSGDGKHVVSGDQPQASSDSGFHQEQSSNSPDDPMNGSGQQGSSKGDVPSPEAHSDPSDEFENISLEDSVSHCTLEHLIKKFRDSRYDTSDQDGFILLKCKVLFERDYELKIVKNKGITANYPKELLIPIARKNAPENEKPMNFDAELYSKLVHEARGARLLSRMVVPVILFDNKFVCRSGSLTVWLSAMYEIAIKGVCASAGENVQVSRTSSYIPNAVSKLIEVTYSAVQCLANSDLMADRLAADLKVMEYLNIEHICDLMVEYYKYYKHRINVGATEKVHGEIYKNMKVQELPFPGSEFFLRYKDSGRTAVDLIPDWNQSDLTRNLELTDDRKDFFPRLQTREWKEWDLNILTCHHLMIMISCLVSGEKGMNVHCISGWDRTPLFVSLLRLSLWADGLIHENLAPYDIAYLTVAYDWYLFGHDLPERLRNGEEIMHFAFNFLENLIDECFSLPRMFQKLTEEEKRGRHMPKYEPGRRINLLRVRRCFLREYDEHVIEELEMS